MILGCFEPFSAINKDISAVFEVSEGSIGCGVTFSVIFWSFPSAVRLKMANCGRFSVDIWHIWWILGVFKKKVHFSEFREFQEHSVPKISNIGRCDFDIKQRDQ